MVFSSWELVEYQSMALSQLFFDADSSFKGLQKDVTLAESEILDLACHRSVFTRIVVLGCLDLAFFSLFDGHFNSIWGSLPICTFSCGQKIILTLNILILAHSKVDSLLLHHRIVHILMHNTGTRHPHFLNLLSCLSTPLHECEFYILPSQSSDQILSWVLFRK